MEGLDISTLALTNVLLGLFLGVGFLVSARTHSLFLGFRALGCSYLLLAFGFTLVGIKQYITDFFSIIIANLAIVTGFSLLILGVLKFLKYECGIYTKISIILLLMMALSLAYFTYVHEDMNARIIIMSALMTGFSLFAGVKVLINKDQIIRTYTRILGLTLLFSTVIYLLRICFIYYQPILNSFIDSDTIHALSFITLQSITIASFFSLSLSANHQLSHNLAIQATKDPLTTIYNRRVFDELALNAVSRAQRERSPLSVVLINVDYFKYINDQFGHQIGDILLKEFSMRLKGCLRQYDILARYSGKEFVLLLPNTNADTAILIAEKLRYCISYPEFDTHDDDSLNVTASFGVATNKGEHINWSQFISLAEQALYHAKDSGRNCVKLHSASVHHLSSMEQHQ